MNVEDILEMGKQIPYAISYIFYVNIVLLNVSVIISKAEILTGYFSNRTYTWKAAKESCMMIKLSDKIQVLDNDERTGWIDATTEYTPWVEYKKCVYVKSEYIQKTSSISYGDQLVQCLQFCKDYHFFGLQQIKCACLNLSVISITTTERACSQKESTTCREDKYALCANISTAFVIYRKVNISEMFFPGNCLGVSSSDGRTNLFWTRSCDFHAFPLCKPGVRIINERIPWINATTKCSNYDLVSYHAYKKLRRSLVGHFWLANIRRPIIQQSSESDPKYCVAMRVRKGDNKYHKEIRQCTQELPALCANIADEDSPGSDSKEPSSNNILLIVLILTAVLAVVVIIVVILLCIRRNSSRSGHRPMIVPNNEVTYSQVNKPTKEKAPVHAGESTRNKTADDTYDHMEHHRLGQNQIPTESNYDTMQSVGNEDLQNNYDVTSGTDRQRQIVVDDTAEYSHMEGEVEYQETKDVST